MKLKKELKEFGIIGAIFLTLYLTGLHTEVAGFAQRVILETGIIGTATELPTEEKTDVDYNLSLKNIKGEVSLLSDHKGKVIFMNVWATWCPPCVAEMPNIQNLYEQVDSTKVSFIMLSMDKEMNRVERFINKKGYTFPVYMPASQVPALFRSPSIPTTYVISSEGKLISKKVGMGKYDKKSFIKFINKHAEGIK